MPSLPPSAPPPLPFGAVLSPLWAVPFLLVLVGIAVLPLVVPHRWESNRNKLLFSLALGLPVAAYFLVADPGRVAHTAGEYVSFLVLIASLYVISGGVHIKGGLLPTPGANTAVLALGAVLASVMGTTGASVLLIRPLLAMNEGRTRRAHTVVFFIFIVANAGGCLTPLGDPPLFMGYLQGVPFLWTLKLWKVWLLAVGLLLAAYYVWDRLAWHSDAAGEGQGVIAEPAPRHDPERLAVSGLALNGPLVAGILGIVVVGQHLPSLAPGLGLRELGMVALALISLWLTPRKIRADNRFTAAPILEVAALFAGIFMTMMPALALLEARGHELGLVSASHFYWASGLLSAFLDNAPTYLAFFALGKGMAASGAVGPEAGALVAGVPASLLLAVSAGSVLMGANTYIGNGPNFMIKAIAEERGVKMPSFLGYMGYSAVVMLPVLTMVWLALFVC